MAWYINVLSLAGQYHDVSIFLENLKQLMRQRQQMPILTRELYCSRGLDNTPIIQTHNFRQAVQS